MPVRPLYPSNEQVATATVDEVFRLECLEWTGE